LRRRALILWRFGQTFHQLLIISRETLQSGFRGAHRAISVRNHGFSHNSSPPVVDRAGKLRIAATFDASAKHCPSGCRRIASSARICVGRAGTESEPAKVALGFQTTGHNAGAGSHRATGGGVGNATALFGCVVGGSRRDRNRRAGQGRSEARHLPRMHGFCQRHRTDWIDRSLRTPMSHLRALSVQQIALWHDGMDRSRMRTFKTEMRTKVEGRLVL
jgi:hypothetical protein